VNDLLLHPLSSGNGSMASGDERAIDTDIEPAKVEDAFTSDGDSATADETDAHVMIVAKNTDVVER